MIMKIVLALVVLLGVPVGAALQAPDAAYLQSFEKWKAELIDDVKQNWLPLAGLFWLKPGANTFGSANDNGIVLPSGPPHAGAFELKGNDVSVGHQPGLQATSGRKCETKANLQ